jgi:hypothetical protein
MDTHTEESIKKRMEALELVATYAKDIVDSWSNFSFRQVRTMCAKMDALKEALELVSK